MQASHEAVKVSKPSVLLSEGSTPRGSASGGDWARGSVRGEERFPPRANVHMRGAGSVLRSVPPRSYIQSSVLAESGCVESATQNTIHDPVICSSVLVNPILCANCEG